MRRKLAGITLGLLLALIVIVLVEAVANRLFHPQLATDASATVASTQQPTDMLVMVVIGWFAAALVGGSVADYICRTRTAAWIVGAAVLCGVIVRLVTEAQPGWMYVAGPLAPLLGAALARSLVERRLVAERPVSDALDSPD